MGLGRRNARQHETVGFQKNALDSSVFWEYKPQQQVMTVDGVSGVVTAVLDGPYPGTEEYEVTLDNGLGGGSYTASQLQPLAGTTASHDHEATGLHTADQDYPELGSILHDRPPIERMTFSAARGDNPFEIRHEEINTRGTKFPRRVDMTAHHPETGEEAGRARYYPPKRRGGPISIDEVKGHAPGAASVLLNEIESRHPGSSTKFLHEVKRNNNNPDVTGHAHEHAGQPTDWDTHYPSVAPTIHRGLSLRLPSYSARTVNSSGSTKDEHLAEIHAAMPTGPNVGTHWTENEHAAQLFAHNAVSDHRTDIPVVLHASTPAKKDLETRRDHLYRGGVFPYGDPHSSENEIPLRRGRDVAVTGISWRPDAAHPDADENGWLHHTYSEPMHHTAAMEDVEDEDTQEAEPELPPCAYCGSDQMQIAGDNGRAQQAKCQVCGGMMSAPYGLQFKPELIGDPSNHPKDDPDPASGGVPGAANMRVPVKRMNDSDYTASLHEAASVADDPGRWEYRQREWDNGNMTFNPISHSKDLGRFALHAEHPDENGDRMIHAVTPEGRYIGHTFFGDHPNHEGYLEGAPEVHPDYRRQGVGTAMYDYAEELGGKPMAPSMSHSDEAAAFWRNRVHGSQHTASDDEQDASYRMQHQAPDADYGAPLHDVENMMPGFYEHPEWYNHGQEHLHESTSVIHGARGNPEKKVKIYRALPAEHAGKGFNTGDWVSTSKSYARQHAMVHPDSKHDWPVISTTVPAKHLHTEGDVHEWAYNGPGSPATGVAFKGGYHQEVRQRPDGSISPVQRKANPFKERAESLKEKGYSFLHYRPGNGDPNHTVVAYDHQDNWAGMVKAHENGDVHHVEIEPEHAHEPLEEHMRDMIAWETKKTGSLHEAGERDWCTFRHNARCFYPGPLNAEGIRLGTPQDRGPCAWDYWQQQVCPISEPGPMALMQAKGSKIDELQDPEFRFHFTASWSDVRAKARRIRSEGQVNITVATNEGVGGEVKGDHHVYETMLTYVPGTYKVGSWECGCKWAAYAWGRSPAYRRFEGRMCFLPGTKISMADGTHKPIEQVRPGDRVLTHDGVGTVRNLWNNHYNGEIVGLTRSGSSRQVWATVDHGMFANTSMRDNIGSSSTKSYRDRKAVRNKDAWGRTEAGALQVGDWLMGTYADAVLTAPTVSLGDLHEHLVLRNGRGRLETPTERSGRIYTGASLPEFAFTNEFAVLLGYYLAEGNVEHKNRHGVPRIVQWTFGAREDEYVAEISAALETLGAGTPRVYRSHNRILIKVSNAALALLLARLTGTHATQKSLHPDLMQAPPEFQETLLRTYLNGDGCESMAATASRELARQIVALGCRTGHYVPREHVATNNRGPANREKGQPIYYVETAGRYMQGRERLWENLYGARITGVERRQYHGPVYNLNVDDQHTYAVEDTVVFNCSHALAMQFEAQAKGMFGRAVEPSTERPKWLRHHTPVVTQFERDSGENLTRRAVPPGNMRRTYEGGRNEDFANAVMADYHQLLNGGVYADNHGLDLVHPPVYAYVIAELQDPVDAMNFMAALGMSHSAARAVVKDASAERATGELHFEASLQLLAEEGEHGGNEKKRCPDCGSMISVNDEKCPHCHHVFSQHEHHHGAKTPGEGDLMSRGMVIGGEWDKDAVHRVMNGNATAHDLLHHIDKSDVGDFWYPHDPSRSHEDNLHGAKEFAQAESSDHPAQDLDRDRPIGETGMVLVGHKPEGWDPKNNPDEGLMGNSYIPHSADVPLHQIHYHDHNGDWHSADATGHSVHVHGGGYDRINSAIHQGAKTPECPTVAGVALKAADTGRILMLQRGLDDEKDPARGTWEIPGGHLEDGDQTSLHGAIREWEEETGQPFPEGGVVHHTWTSPNGIYQGHVVMIPEERAVEFHNGRQVVNPDNPDGDCHEQAAWWDPDHARKNPALREELKTGTPWKEIKAAGNTKTAATADPLYGLEEASPMSPPQHSRSQNPASTGWATAQDPHSWDDPEDNATNFGALPGDGFLGSLHDEPEAALPSTDGAESELEDERDDASPSQYDENDAELTPNTTLASAGSTSDIVARFQATAAASALGGGKDGGSHHAAQQTNNKEIARAAQEFLTKRALKDFNFAEQQELINEGARDKTMARNSDVLDIEGTHYNALEAALAAEEALEDSAELFV